MMTGDTHAQCAPYPLAENFEEARTRDVRLLLDT